jgi:hypothetical protein
MKIFSLPFELLFTVQLPVDLWPMYCYDFTLYTFHQFPSGYVVQFIVETVFFDSRVSIMYVQFLMTSDTSWPQ